MARKRASSMMAPYAKRRRTLRQYRPVYRPETRYNNTTISHASTTSSDTPITSVAADDSSQGRSGRRITCKSIEIRLARTTASTFCRCIVYVPKTTSTFMSLVSAFDTVDNDDFWVLYDQLLPTDSATANIFIRQLLKTEYDGVGSADVVKNPIQLYLHTATAETITGHTKLWFIDN